MNWLISDVLAFARMSSAAYGSDSKDATNAAAPGVEWIGQVGNDQCQATIARWGGLALLVFRGTQFGGLNTSLPEVWDDIDPGSVELDGGLKVHAGSWGPMISLWPDIEKLMPPGQPLVIGHSLGGVRAHQARALLRNAEVVSFGAICGANDAFWWWAYDGDYPLRVVHENDFAPDWKEPWVQPGPMLWLRGGGAVKAYARAGVSTTILDPVAVDAHSIDKQYVPALEKVVASGCGSRTAP